MQNEFEKQVRQKMDELQIHPSETVWENVKVQITKPERKRWTIILLFVIAGIFLGGYWLWQPDYKHKSISQLKNTGKNNQTIIENKKMNEDNHVKVTKPNPNYNRGSKLISSSIVTYNRSSKKPLAKFNEDEKNEIVDAKTEIINDTHSEIEPVFTESDKNEIANANGKQDSLTSQPLTAEIKPKDETPGLSPTKHTISLKQSHKWKLGVSVSAGVSGVADNFLGVGEDKSLADAYSSSPGTGGVNTGSNGTAIPSKLQRAGGFIAGDFAEKYISKTKKFSVGINYKNYSTTNRVGEKNDTTNYFRLNNSGNKYHNSFNFIELPVSLKFQLWNGKKVPLFLHSGFVVSQLINSNSLQYNLTSQSYSNNNSLLNKTQIGFTTGLSASLFSKQKTTLLIGPDFYFGATSLARSGLYTKKHFSYIGLRSEIIFGKK
jgi:hypothetical protein